MSLDGFLRVNNTTFAWASSILQIDGFGIEGFLSIDYEQKREVKVVHAARQSGLPVAWAGGGKYTVPSFKTKMLKDTWMVVKSYLAAGGLIAPGLGSYGDAQVSITLQAVDPTILSPPLTLVASPARVVGDRESRAEGVDELVQEVDWSVLQLVENGIPLWSVVRQAAEAI